MFIANEESFGKKIFALAIPLSSINPVFIVTQSWVRGIRDQEGGQGAGWGGWRELRDLCASGSGADDAEELQDPAITELSDILSHRGDQLLLLSPSVKRKTKGII